MNKSGKEIIWNKEQYLSFRACVPDKAHRLVYDLMIQCGLRAGEVLALTWDHVDADQHFIHVEGSLSSEGTIVPCKMKFSNRVVPLPQSLVTDLIDYKDQLKDPDGKSRIFLIQRNQLAHNFDRTMQKLSPEIPRAQLSSLRKSFARISLKDGVNPVELTGQLGHDTIAVEHSVLAYHA